MAATIKDIARKVNVSVSTVSYALNGGPRSVPDEVRDRVLEAARELNYRPNRLARSMVTGRSQTIGVVPPVIGTNAFLSPYLHLAINGIANVADELHQDVLLFTRSGTTDNEELLSILVDGRVDGVIFIAPQMNRKTVELATSLHLPCVTVSGVPLEGVLSFCADNQTGMQDALQHLYDLGHRKIGHITGRLDHQDAILRLQGYQQFLEQNGLPYREEWVEMGQFVIEGGQKAAARLFDLPDSPTAIMCANDEMAVGVYAEAYQRGMKIPDDISVVGFDATPSSAHVFPALTTVRQPIGELGQAAMKSLFDLIEGRVPTDPTVLSTELLVRASTSSPKEDNHDS